MFKGLGQLANLGATMGKLQAMQAELKEKRVTGAAGGGLVEIEATGAGEVLAVRIAPTLMEKPEGPDREMIEDLIASAVNDVSQKAKQMYAETMQDAAGDLNIPGLGDMLNRFGGAQ
ncbi:MAG: YbaB/EbfC family nucleoid-associated protein [Planctomycetota bacterium]